MAESKLEKRTFSEAFTVENQPKDQNEIDLDDLE